MRVARRSRSADCSDCGGRVHLARCGVDAHLRTRTRREVAEGRCTGYVYIHAEGGGIDCPD